MLLMSISPVHSATIAFITLITFTPLLIADHGITPNLSIGGRVKLDTIYNFDSVGGVRTSKSDLAFSPGSIPISNNGKNELNANLRESRLWATLNLPIGEQKLSTYVEFDFFNSRRDNLGRSHVGNDPRMRHLYLAFKNFTMGKTYTTFVNLSSYPEINDSNGPVGVLNIRQELIRYNKNFSWGNLFLAIEKPESTFTSTTGNSFQVNDDQIPDFIGKLEFSKAWGNWSLSTMIREINADNKMMTGINDTEWGGAISAAGRILFPKQDNLRFSFSYGNALGRYLSFNAFDDATIDNTGNINLTEIFSGYMAYQHWWTNTLRSSFVVGAAYANQDTSKVPASVDKLFASSNVNLLWSPSLKSSIGLEWLHGYRELENGNSGHMDRLQFSAIYKF
jgi:outer membrane DcaP-like protein